MLIGATKMPFLLALFKGDPLVDVAGAYFPAWLACMAVGAAGTWAARAAAERTGLGAVMQPAPLMFPAVFIGLTCLAWLVGFAAR
jgi:hypothetical protein